MCYTKAPPDGRCFCVKRMRKGLCEREGVPAKTVDTTRAPRSQLLFSKGAPSRGHLWNEALLSLTQHATGMLLPACALRKSELVSSLFLLPKTKHHPRGWCFVLERATSFSPKRCLWQIKRSEKKEVSRFSGPREWAGKRQTQRERRGANFCFPKVSHRGVTFGMRLSSHCGNDYQSLPADFVCSLCSHKIRIRFEPLSTFQNKTPPFWVVFCFGAGDEARTRYLDLGKVALYQMSYARKRKVDYSGEKMLCQEVFSKNTPT